MTTRIGTSGFSYPLWYSGALTEMCEGFYPKKADALSYYSTKFDFVEIDGTFYKNPTKATVMSWRDKTPSGFAFVVKFCKYGTHTKKLIDFGKIFDDFWLDRLEHLGDKCAGILIQLPPSFKNTSSHSSVDGLTPLQRLRVAGEHTLRYKVQIFVEFRDTSWFSSDVYKVLTEVKWSLVCTNVNNTSGDFGDLKSGFNPPLETLPLTKPLTIYFRCHGTDSKVYHGGYSDEDLVAMISFASATHAQHVIYAFDNTDSFDGTIRLGTKIAVIPGRALIPDAVKDALRLKTII